jgi:uncharacterized protein YbjT (DUF2867 family)
MDPRQDEERVLVVGATRGTGGEIVKRLLRDGFRVRALARDEHKARSTLGDDVEVIHGDVTRRGTLAPAMREVQHVIFTAGVTKRPASQRSIIAVEFDGVKNTLAAAREAGVSGRVLYMTAIGVTRHSIASIGLNLIKGRTLVWRRRAEDEIRRSSSDYTIIRCGVLRNEPAGRHAIKISQRDSPMAFWRRIGRADAAEVFVQALQHPSTSRTVFDATWSRREGPSDWEDLFSRLRPDPAWISRQERDR